ncbi:MAG: tetratricopeptide repeat protein [Theionarchaea archaeon]|nr:tetratricopeptide repeat protein [Theionarchaea archaeon]
MDVKELVKKGDKLRESKDGNLGEALQIYELALGLDPHNVGALNGKGIISYKKGEYEKALEIFKKALDIEPKCGRAWFNLGATYDALNRSMKALEVYEKVIEIDPISDYASYAWYNKGHTHSNFEKYEDALRAFNKAIKIKPDNRESIYSKGATLYRLERFEEALKAFNKAIDIEPDYYNAIYSKGATLYRLERFEEALKVFEDLLDKNPSYIKALNARGVILGELGRDEDALEAFKEAIKRNKDHEDVSPYVYLGKFHFDHGNLKRASECVIDALSGNPKSSEALVLGGLIQIEAQQYDCAIKCFEEAIDSNANDIEPLLWIAYSRYLKAECILRGGSKENDEEILSKKYREEIFAIIRELEKADNLCNRREEKKLKACVLYFLGNFYYRSKDIFAAKEKLEECVNLGTASSAEKRARELLENIWNNKMKPRWWVWWLDSPINRKRRMFMFCVFSFVLILLVLPLFFQLIPLRKTNLLGEVNQPGTGEVNQPEKVDWPGEGGLPIYLITIGLLILLLLSPEIESIKAGEIDIKMRSQPPSFESLISPLMMKVSIEELSDPS